MSPDTEAEPEIQVATATYSLQEAKEVIAGYAFGAGTTPAWRQPSSAEKEYGSVPRASGMAAPRWAYRSYDCLPTPQEVTVQDLLAPAGLNGRLSVARVLGMSTVLPEFNETIKKIDDETTFWGLSREELVQPEHDSQGWSLSRCWWLLRGAAGPSAWVTTYKVLHHIRPRLFPLIDRSTGPALGDSWWRTIHRDLQEQKRAFEDLEGWFEALAKRQPDPGKPLTRLRLHDILLWCDQTRGNRNAASSAGRDVLNQESG